MPDELQLHDTQGNDVLVRLAGEDSPPQHQGLCELSVVALPSLYFDRPAVGLLIAQLQKIQGVMR